MSTPLHLVSPARIRIALRDMATGEQADLRWATRITWTMTPASTGIEVELVDVPELRAIEPLARHYGLYIELENGQTIGPFYFERDRGDSVEFTEAESDTFPGVFLWRLVGPFMERQRGAPQEVAP